MPAPVRLVMRFETQGIVAIGRWLLRRRDGVPPGAVAVPYERGQATMLTIVIVLTAVETVVAEVLLRALGAPTVVRVILLVAGGYTVLFGLAVRAGFATRPHVVTAEELRVRCGVFFDLRVPRSLITSVRLARNYNEPGMVTVRDGRLGVAMSAQTNIVVELAEPVPAVRPLGAIAQVSTVAFYADRPADALAFLTAGKRVSDRAE